jgi:hypothetical protein
MGTFLFLFVILRRSFEQVLFFIKDKGLGYTYKTKYPFPSMEKEKDIFRKTILGH